jgi:hypothetical protein
MAPLAAAITIAWFGGDAWFRGDAWFGGGGCGGVE